MMSETGSESILSDMSQGVPALCRAAAIQTRVAEHGFDWPEILPVFDKVEEEFQELKEAFASEDPDHIAEELGDLLFVVVNLARHLNLDPELTLKQSNKKFIDRFQYLEMLVKLSDRALIDCSLAELDGLWEQAKRDLRRSKTQSTT